MLPAVIYVLPSAWRHLGDPDATTELWVLLVTTISIATSLCLYGVTVALGSGPRLLLAAFTAQILVGLWLFGRLLTRENWRWSIRCVVPPHNNLLNQTESLAG
jgi:hypothetical protein